MTAEAFWDAAPCETDALARVLLNRNDLEAERFSTIASALYNQAYRREDKKLYTRQDFGARTPAPIAEKDAWKKLYPQSEDQLRLKMAQFFGADKEINES